MNISIHGFQPVWGQFNGFGTGGNTAQSVAEATPSVNAGKFDTFLNEAGQSFVEKLYSAVGGGIKGIMELSASDRRSLASMYKDNMKRLVNEAIDHEKAEAERYKELKEKKAYYKGVVDEDGYVRDGKFAFSGKVKTYVDKSDAEELLKAVQSEIDDLVTAKAAKEDPFNLKNFEYIYSGVAFLAATDKAYDDAVRIDDFSISGQWSRTEDNFLEESDSTVKSLESRLKSIDGMYKAFLDDKDFERRVASGGFDKKKLDALMANFNKWTKNALFRLAEVGGAGEDDLMKSVETIIGGKEKA